MSRFAALIHRSRPDLTTSVSPPMRSDPCALAGACVAASEMPSVRTSRHASPAAPAIKAAQTSNRFADPSVDASGAVTTPR